MNSVPDGVQVGWLTSGGSFFQDLGVAVDASKTYQLNLSVGTEFDNSLPTTATRSLWLPGASGTVIAERAGRCRGLRTGRRFRFLVKARGTEPGSPDQGNCRTAFVL